MQSTPDIHDNHLTLCMDLMSLLDGVDRRCSSASLWRR